MERTGHLFMALIAISCFCQGTYAQKKYLTTGADRAVAEEVMRSLHEASAVAESSGRSLSTADLMVMAAESLLGTPYVAGTLDEDPIREDLRIYLTKTDCIIFVETCLNLARSVKECGDVPSFDRFAANVAATRYRVKGPPYSYGDRIHYTTEWLRRQEGSLRDITLDLGGEVNNHPIFFMTRNHKLYKQLSDAANIPRAALDLKKIGEAEEELNKVPMTHIPRAKVAAAEDGIESGDIICFVSKVDGLDIAHVAIAYIKEGRRGFIHASQADGKVEIDSRTVSEYVASRSNLTGIKVIRPL